MSNSDLHIIERICTWRQAQLDVVLFTVIQTWGSSPRPIGSMLAICSNGEFAGSVSGGCVDDELLSRVAAGHFNQCSSHFIYFGDTTASQIEFGLPCGGQLKLLVECEISLQFFTIILESLKNRQCISRRIFLDTQDPSLLNTTHADILHADGHNMWRNYGPTWRMLLIGAGELSQFVCKFSALLDYHVVVCDPREAYQKSWPIETIVVNKHMPDDVVREIKPDERTIILTLSHDPKLDDMALMTALQLKTFYIGALGSKKSSEERRIRLKELGVSEQDITRLHAPVGLDIGSRTPAEIALAILADITARRHRKSLTATP